MTDQINSKSLFLPDNELLKFAIDFSNKYEHLPVGEYHSLNGKYSISYSENTPRLISMVNHSNSLLFILDKKLLCENDGYSSDFVFYIITWLFIMKKTSVLTTLECDQVATDYYLTTGRSKRNLAFGFLEYIKTCRSSFQNSRFEIITSLIQKQDPSIIPIIHFVDDLSVKRAIFKGIDTAEFTKLQMAFCGTKITVKSRSEFATSVQGIAKATCPVCIEKWTERLNKPFDCEHCSALLNQEDIIQLSPHDLKRVCLTCREKGAHL